MTDEPSRAAPGDGTQEVVPSGPLFRTIRYFDPFAPLPVGQNQAGIVITMAAPVAGKAPFARLLANLMPVDSGGGALGERTAIILNAAPLSPTILYQVQVLFQTQGGTPNWNGPGVATGAVATQNLRITAMIVTPGGITYSWEAPTGTATAGTFLQLVDSNTGSVTFISTPAAGSPVTVVPTAGFVDGHDYYVLLFAAQPIYPATGGGFAAPFASGPPAKAWIPTRSPQITGVTCGAGSVAAAWNPPVLSAAVLAPNLRYEIVLLDGAQIVASAPAGAGGGHLEATTLAALAAPKVAGRISYGTFTGPLGTAVAVYPQAPVVRSVTVTAGSPATIQALVALPSGVQGGTLAGTLYSNGGNPQAASAAAPGSLGWTVAAVAGTSYAIDVAMVVAAAGGATSRSPSSPRIAVPMEVPQGATAAYDGETVTIGFTLASSRPADGYRVSLAGSGGGTQTVEVGPGLPIAVPAALDLGQTWTATVTPRFGMVATISATAAVTLPAIAAPTLTSVVYDGTSLFLIWSPATLPFLTGYQVAIGANAALVFPSGRTSCVVPLAPSQATGNVTVTGLSRLRNTPPSAAVALATGTVEITALTIGANVVATWTAGGSPASAMAELLVDGAVVRQIAGTATGVTFPMPLPAGLPYRLRARPVSATGAVGMPGKAVPFLTAAPTGLRVNYDGATLSASWDPIADPGVDGYWVTVTGAGLTAPARVAGNSWSMTLAAPGEVVTVAVAAAGGLVAGPAAAPVRALTAATSLMKVDFDGSTATMTWLRIPGAQSYVVRLFNDVEEVARGTTNQTSIVLAAPESAAPLRTSVAALASNSSGPASGPIALARAGPIVAGAVADPGTGAVAVSWPAVAGATGYSTQFYLRGQPYGSAAPGPSPAALPAELQGVAGVQAAVSIAAAAGNVALTGPPGPRFDIPADRPQHLSVDYDGAAVSASWAALPGASRYRLSILDPSGATVAHQDSDGARTSLAFTPQGATAYSAVVQVLAAESTGPPSQPGPLFTQGWYVATGPAQPPPAPPSLPPRLFRPASLALQPVAMTLYLPQIGPVTGGLTRTPIAPLPVRPGPPPPTPPPPAQPPLTLAEIPNPSSPYSCKLDISAGALAFDAQSRADLRSCYVQLLRLAEAGGATGPGIFALQQAISRAIPQTFDDSLFFAFGMDSAAAYVDLRPGMVLQVAYTSYAPMAGRNAPVFSDGYSGSAALDYAIDDYYDSTGRWKVGADTFAAWLTSNGIVQVSPPTLSADSPPTLSGAADAADLFFPAFRRQFLRLFFPDQLQPALPPASGQISRQFAIAAADKWSDLPQTLNSVGALFSVAYFGGRSVLRPCMRVTVDGIGRVVPVGTSVGNLLDSLARRPPGTNVRLRGIRLERGPGPVVLDPAAAFDASAYVPVRLDYGPLGNIEGQPDILSLPLLPGDKIAFGPAG